MMQHAYLDNQAIDNNVITLKRKNYLINSFLDSFLLGGSSILVFIIAIILFKTNEINPKCTQFLFYLAFLVNFPHFLLSYQLLYMDFGHLILKKLRFFWAGVIVPCLLMIGLFFTAYFSSKSLGYFANALFFFVGWHYVKQILGTIMVAHVLQKKFYTKTERFLVQTNLLSIWIISWVWSNLSDSKSLYEGIPYYSLNFPRYLITYCYAIVIITLLALLFTHWRKYKKENYKPPLAAVISFISIYIWFIPVFYNPTFFYCIPFFHSLQYLPFVYTFRRNKLKSNLQNVDPSIQQKTFFFQFYGYLLFSVFLGANFFYFIPHFLDRLIIVDKDLYGPTLFMFCFTIFINIHHYFIDNVLWKKNNDEMQKYMFQN